MHVNDCREINPDLCGTFDAVASLGAVEHFCSPDEFRAWKSQQRYCDFFANLITVLPTGGHFFLQTGSFGPSVPPITEFGLNAERDSDEYAIPLTSYDTPASWLPPSLDQVVECTSATSTPSTAGSITSRR